MNAACGKNPSSSKIQSTLWELVIIIYWHLLSATIQHHLLYIYTTTLGPLSLSSLLSSPVNKLTVQYKANYFGNAVNHVQKNNLYSHKEWNMSICKFKMKEKKRRYEKESDKIKLKSKKSHNSELDLNNRKTYWPIRQTHQS